MSLIYAVGDIHGCYDQLREAVAAIKAHAGAADYRVFFLGDYVDRGSRSRETVRLVKALVTDPATKGRWFALRGNHEALMIDGMEGTRFELWLENGGGATIDSYFDHAAEAREHAGWFATLPTLIETEYHVFVHAGLSPRYASLAEQPEDVRLWIRGWERDDHDFGKHVVYGHTPREKPLLYAHSTGLDTGACYGGPLSVGVFDAEVKAGPVDIFQVI
jgi:serine/threonine protein phosphatase 1